MNQSAEEIRAAVNAVADEERRTHAPGTEPDREPEAEPIPSADILRALQRNEDGDADLFIRLHRGRLVYDHAAGQWFTWAGHHWATDTTEEALAVAEAPTLRFRNEAAAWTRAGRRRPQTKAADAAKNLEASLARRVRDPRTIRRNKLFCTLHGRGRYPGRRRWTPTL